MDLYAWFQDVLISFGEVSAWLVKPIGDFTPPLTPLGLITAGGLIVYLGVAVTKWLLS